MNIKSSISIILSSLFFIALIFGFNNTVQADNGVINNGVTHNNVIKMMTLNLHDGKDENNLNNSVKTIKLLQVENPDVIALQEVEPRELKIFKNAGYFVIAGMNYNLFRYHFGNAILTRHKVIYSRHHYLPGNLEQRGLDEAAIDVAGTQFIILNTHLGLGKTERQRQFAEIRRIIGFLRGPILLAGDFNGEPTDILFSEFKQDYQEIGAVIPLSGSFPAANPKERLDQIWCSPDWDVKTARVIPWDGSDHHPVEAEMQLTNPEVHSVIPSEIPDPPAEPNPLLPEVDHPTRNVVVSIRSAQGVQTPGGSVTFPIQNKLSLSAQSDSTGTGVSLNYRLFVIDLRDFLSHWKIRGKSAWTISAATDPESATRLSLEQYYRWSDRNGTKITASLQDEKLNGGIEETVLISDHWGLTATYDSNRDLSFSVALTPDKRQVYSLTWHRKQNNSECLTTWNYHF